MSYPAQKQKMGYNRMAKVQEEEPRLELTINGKTKSFRSGYQMWQWANQQKRGKLETTFSEKDGPFLSDFFQKLWEHRKKK